MTTITIPEFSVVVLVGPSGSGKSTFARRHFLESEILSSDACRAMVSDDETSLEATASAFELLHFIMEKRLEAKRLCVVDATNVRREDRAELVRLAKRHHALAVAIVLHLDADLCHSRNQERPNRQFGAHVPRNHSKLLRRSLKGMRREGFRQVEVLDSVEAIDAATIARTRMWTDRSDELGPFDIIGDIHGCYDELLALLERLGYAIRHHEEEDRLTIETPPDRRAVFLGDLVDRGPKVPQVLRLVMQMVDDGQALCVPGNHEVKLLRAMQGRKVKVQHGLEASLDQLEACTSAFRDQVMAFIDGLVSHAVLDEGKLVVAHAGMKERYAGRASARVRSFALYGETSGEVDAYGLPVRHNWASDYRGEAMVVYGHTPVLEAEWLNNTICIDTGCVFGGKLSALRYPERELVEVAAAEVYAEPVRPLSMASGLSAQQLDDRDLDLGELRGKLHLSTTLMPKLTIDADRGAAALELISRFAVDPRWLVHLPATMSPAPTSSIESYLEHPSEAFDELSRWGVGEVVCQEKHMGSRAIVVVCASAQAAEARFGVEDGRRGRITSRTGRPFFRDDATEAALLAHLDARLREQGFYERFASEWFVLDCELMPWSHKARELLRRQYAAVGAAANAALPTVHRAMAQAQERGVDMRGLVELVEGRQARAQGFVEAYRRYCWPVESLEDFKLAPFHLLASEGKVHSDRDHVWHMETLAELADEGIIAQTPWRLVALADPSSRHEATVWWRDRCAQGSEGMVLKPRRFVHRSEKGKLMQPAIKCRGPEYLRLIYGPDYDEGPRLERLRKRGLGRKRSLALREFALGLEALERFVDKRPLREIHRLVFAILALEATPVDPRL